MSTEVLTFTPNFGFEESVDFQTLIFEADSGKEKRRSKMASPIRSLDFSLENEIEADSDLIWKFYVARRGRYDPFWVKFPSKENSQVVGESVGTGNGVENSFILDCFPVDSGSLKIYVAGALQTSGYVVSNDLTLQQSKIVFTVPPSGQITADYDFYIQVRFKEDRLSRQGVSVKLFNSSITLVEVLWDIYEAPFVYGS